MYLIHSIEKKRQDRASCRRAADSGHQQRIVDSTARAICLVSTKHLFIFLAILLGRRAGDINECSGRVTAGYDECRRVREAGWVHRVGQCDEPTSTHSNSIHSEMLPIFIYIYIPFAG